VGGIVGSTAFDGDGIYGPTTQGYLFSISVHDGSIDWLTPVGDGAHYAEAVSVAKGVVYTVDFKGFLDAYDAVTGAPLLHHPIQADVQSPLTISWGSGVSIARNTVYVETGISGLPTGYVIAYRPA
jgi:outer membrane protein assembly factor BamB